MSLQELLGSNCPGSLSCSAFLEHYYLQLPFALRGACHPWRELGSWQSVERILSRPRADALVVRQGEQRPGDAPPTYVEDRALHAEGYTIVLRHVERQDPAFAELAAAFHRELLAPLDIHLYCTPASQFGFSWHYDAEEVFILQTEGRKEYSLRKNTVNPWPLIDAMPTDMAFEREIMPVMQCTLEAGDWLYIPGGYWHRAQSQEDATSIAVGVVAATALDLLDFVRQRLPQSLVWRQRLPVGAASGGSTEGPAPAATLAEHLGRDLAQMLGDEPTMREFWDFQRQRLAAQEAGWPQDSPESRPTAVETRPSEASEADSDSSGDKMVAGQRLVPEATRPLVP